MKYNFDEIIDRRGTGSVKWDFGELLVQMGFTDHYDNDTLPLFTADMDIAVPPCIVEAMKKVTDRRIYGYTMPMDSYYDSIINWFMKRHNWEIKKDEIIHCPGTVYALGVAVRAFTEVGEGVIIQRPVYTPFTSTIESNNRKVANNQMILNDDGTYSVDIKGFEEEAKKPENKLFILCNPHNPTGRIFSNEELKEMSRICKENNVVIIADEIHGDLIRCDSKFVPIAKIAKSTEHIVTCTAINKTFNVAGLHATNIIISGKELREKFKKELGMLLPTPFTTAAVEAAYNEGEEWLEEIKKYFDETIEWVLQFSKENLPKMKCVKPEGTYILWMDFRGYGLSRDEIRKKIYVDANVALEEGTMFDPDKGEGFERMCLSSPRAMVQEAFKRIAEQFKDL